MCLLSSMKMSVVKKKKGLLGAVETKPSKCNSAIIKGNSNAEFWFIMQSDRDKLIGLLFDWINMFLNSL